MGINLYLPNSTLYTPPYSLPFPKLVFLPKDKDKDGFVSRLQSPILDTVLFVVEDGVEDTEDTGVLSTECIDAIFVDGTTGLLLYCRDGDR